ncbi:MAG: hypothetical protein KIT69_21370 [Propionibacteriaceae bacterium]|nr:hypothetical protein [Propionibacteriaceae bacterium]
MIGKETGRGQETEKSARDAIVGPILLGATAAILASGIAAIRVVLGLNGVGLVPGLGKTNGAIAAALARDMIIMNEADHVDETAAVPAPESIGGKGADLEPERTGGKRVVREEMTPGLDFGLTGENEVGRGETGAVLVTFVWEGQIITILVIETAKNALLYADGVEKEIGTQIGIGTGTESGIVKGTARAAHVHDLARLCDPIQARARTSSRNGRWRK